MPICFFYPAELNEYEQKKQAGISMGIYEFMKDFVTEEDNYQDGPIECICTNLFTIVYKEVEPNFFLAMVVSYENLLTDRVSPVTSSCCLSIQLRMR